MVRRCYSVRCCHHRDKQEMYLCNGTFIHYLQSTHNDKGNHKDATVQQQKATHASSKWTRKSAVHSCPRACAQDSIIPCLCLIQTSAVNLCRARYNLRKWPMHSPGVNLVHYASVLYAMLAIIESKKMLGVFFPPGSPLFLFLWQTKFSNVFTSFPHNHSGGFSNFSPGICWHVLVLVLSNGHFFSIFKLL